jgi:hypothetical protein
MFFSTMSYPNLPSSASVVHPDALGLPPEHNNDLLEPPLEVKGNEPEPLVELHRTYVPALSLTKLTYQ